MAGLYFTVGADFGKLQKLKKEIDDLKIKLIGMDKAANPKEFVLLEKQLARLSKEFDREAVAAQHAGAMMSKAGKNADSAASAINKLVGGLKQVGQAAGITIALDKIFDLGKTIINVRGEIESMEKSFDVLLGAKDKADALINSMKQIALKSDYSLTDLSSGAQTLLGFGVDEKQIVPILEQIGNIAMGNTERFGSLTLAFAQMSSTGKLMGQDLLQMINAGFNPLQIIAEKTGKSIGDLKKEMEMGAISAEMVAEAFRSATTEGGKFAGMMENQADSIKGSEAELSDAIQNAFNDIGESHSELIKGGYDVATSLVKNYQSVGEVLVGLIATYGVYKATIITVNALEKQKLLFNKLVAEFIPLETALRKGATAAMIQEAAANRALNTIKGNLITTTKSLLKTLAPNPYLLATAAVISLIYGVYKLSTATSAQETAQKALNKVLNEGKQKKDDLIGKTDDLIGVVNNETKTVFERIEAYQELQKLYPKHLANMKQQEFAALSLTEQQILLNQAINDFDLSNKDEILNDYKQLEKALQDAKKTRSDHYDDTSSVLKNISQALDISFWTRLTMSESDVEDLLKQHIASLEDQKRKREENLKQAEFESKTEEEKKDILQRQLESIKEQEEALTENILASGEFVKNIDGSISPANELKDKFNDINSIIIDWSSNPFAVSNIFTNANPAVNILIQQLKDLNIEKQKVLGQLTTQDEPIVNKKFLEKQVADFNEFKNSLDHKILSKLKNQKDEISGVGVLLPEKYEEFENIKKKYNDLKEDAKKAQEELKIYDDTTKNTGNYEPNRNYKDYQDYNRISEDQTKKNIRAAEDFAIQLSEAEVNAMDEGSKKVLAQLELNYEKQKLALKRQQENALNTKKEDARALFEALPKNEGKAFDSSNIELTNDEIKKFQDLQTKNTEQFEKEKFNLEIQYMREYISEYGTFQQKKLIIAEQYNKKIASSANEWEKKTLEAQKQASLSQIDLEAINKKIDWQNVFGNFGTMLKDQLSPTIDSLKEIAKSEKFKEASLEDQKELYQLISRLEQGNATFEKTIFKDVADDLNSLQDVIKKRDNAIIAETRASENLTIAKQKLQEAEEKGIDLTDAQNAVNVAQEAFNEASKNVILFSNEAEESSINLKTSTSNALNALGEFSSAINELTSGSLQGIGNGLMQIDKLFNNSKATEAVGQGVLQLLGENSNVSKAISKAFANGGFVGEIISDLLSILDVLKEGIGTLISNLIDTVLNSIDGILSNILSGQFIGQIAGSLKNGVENILNSISFGGFSSIINSLGGSNAKEVKEAIDKLTTRNETLGKSIDRLTDVMDKVAGAESLSAYSQAKKYQEERNDNLLQIAREQARYSGSHHSWQKRMGWTDEQLTWAQENVDKNFSGTNSLWELTPEQMSKLLSNDSIYEQIYNAGKGGYGGRVMEKLEAYADQAGNLEELTNKINESLMQISFDSLRSSFLDSLMDMDKDAKSFSEDFSEYMQQALLNFAMGELLDQDLKEWYNGVADLMKDQNGKLTSEQLEAARKEYEGIAQKGINTRDEIASLTGYTGKDSSSSQQASKGVYQGMSQDTGDRLEARNTAIYLETSKIGSNIISISADVRNMTSQLVRVGILTEQSLTHMEEIKTIQLNAFYELKDINNNTKELYQINQRMGEMNDKLSRL